ncbi:hypothetical protein PENTCL1PPCAC_4011, partial [Pristionchus entomophagus]
IRPHMCNLSFLDTILIPFPENEAKKRPAETRIDSMDDSFEEKVNDRSHKRSHSSVHQKLNHAEEEMSDTESVPAANPAFSLSQCDKKFDSKRFLNLHSYVHN